MKIRNLNTIISREYMTRVRKKSFLLITFLGPIFFAAICILPSLIMTFSEEDTKTVAVVDQSGIVADKCHDDKLFRFEDYSNCSPDSLRNNFGNLDVDALVVVSPYDTTSKSVIVSAYSSKPMSVDTKTALSAKISQIVESHRVGLYTEELGIDDLGQIINDVKVVVPVITFTIDDDGEEKVVSSEVYMFISLILSMIIYMFIAMFSGMVMQSVIEEKASRVVEVLVSSVKATELMFGKIIGVALVAMTQFFLWIALTAVLVFGISYFAGFDSIFGQQPAPAAVQVSDNSTGADVVADLTTVGNPADAMDMTSMMDPTNMTGAVAMPQNVEGGDTMSAVLQTLAELDYITLLLAFLIYFVLGYLLYSSFFAAIGSAVENEADTQQLQIPVTIPLMLAFFIAFYAFKAPDSQIVFWGSMIPFTSPIVMLARIPFGVPGWEIALSIGILLLTFILCGWMSAKIYRIGILMFGKKTTFKDLWKWLKQK